MINRYTVIGQPIAHSLSPVVHQLFGELTQRKINYTRTEGTPETFERIVLDFQKAGGKGCNVTAPFKGDAAKLCDKVVPNALLAAAVNTIHLQRDGLKVGYNTDGAGLVADIQVNHQRVLESKRILILGAGGAARGVVAPLLRANPSVLHIANRTAEKAADLAKLFADIAQVSASGYNDLQDQREFDFIINATSPSPDGGMPTIPENIVGPSSLAYDMTYATQETAFMNWGSSQGAEVCNGLGMLVEQAAESFFIWEGVRPKTRLVYPRLAEMLS